MRIIRIIVLAILILCQAGMTAGQQASQKQPAANPQSPKPEKLVELTGLDPTLMDKSVDPCVDFYQYSCGGWLKQNPVPADQASYGRDTELAERNRLILRDILEKAAVERSGRSAVEQKIGDYYASCMDESAIEKKGAAALKPELDRIDRKSVV